MICNWFFNTFNATIKFSLVIVSFVNTSTYEIIPNSRNNWLSIQTRHLKPSITWMNGTFCYNTPLLVVSLTDNLHVQRLPTPRANGKRFFQSLTRQVMSQQCTHMWLHMFNILQHKIHTKGTEINARKSRRCSRSMRNLSLSQIIQVNRCLTR